jgi:hypothetical protein
MAARRAAHYAGRRRGMAARHAGRARGRHAKTARGCRTSAQGARTAQTFRTARAAQSPAAARNEVAAQSARNAPHAAAAPRARCGTDVRTAQTAADAPHAGDVRAAPDAPCAADARPAPDARIVRHAAGGAPRAQSGDDRAALRDLRARAGVRRDVLRSVVRNLDHDCWDVIFSWRRGTRKTTPRHRLATVIGRAEMPMLGLAPQSR